MKPAVSFFLPAILLLGLIACSNTDDPINYEDLLGVVWNLDSLQTPDTTIVAPQYGLATILFTEDMGVRGHRAQSNYRGIYEITGNGLLIEVVEPAEPRCSRPMIQCIFLDALENVTMYEVNENRLDLYKGDRYILYFHPSLIEEELLDKLWKIDFLQIPAGKIVPINDTLIMMIQLGDTTLVPSWEKSIMTTQFNIDMEIGGKAVCNTYFGVYEISEKGKIAISPVGLTEEGCSKWSWIESSFMDALENITRYDVTDSTLILYDVSHNYSTNFHLE